MNSEPSPRIRRLSRTRRSLRNVAIAVIAAIPITACSSDTSHAPPAALTRGPVTASGAFSFAEEPVLTFDLPAGWATSASGDLVFKVGADREWLNAVSFLDIANIYSDSCRGELFNPPVGPTVDDLAAAWAKRPDLHTAISDITVDGYKGKQVDITVPDYNEDENCDNSTFGVWLERGQFGNNPIGATEPHQHHQLWILDVNGRRHVISATYLPNTSQQDRNDLDQILNSIQIG